MSRWEAVNYSIQSLPSFNVAITLVFLGVTLAPTTWDLRVAPRGKDTPSCIPRSKLEIFPCWSMFPAFAIGQFSLCVTVLCFWFKGVTNYISLARVKFAFGLIIWALVYGKSIGYNPYYIKTLMLTLLLVIMWDLYQLSDLLLGHRPLRCSEGFFYCPICRDHQILTADAAFHDCSAKIQLLRWTDPGGFKRGLFSWLNPFISAVRTGLSLNQTVLPRLQTENSAFKLREELDSLGYFDSSSSSDRKQKEGHSSPSLWKRLIFGTSVGHLFWKIVPLKILQDFLQIIAPVIVGRLVKYMGSDGNFETGLLHCGEMLLVLMLQGATFQTYLSFLYNISMDTNTMLKLLLISKTLNMKVGQSSASVDLSESSFLSYSAVDATRVADATVFLHNMWGHPVLIMMCLAVLFTYVGVITSLVAVSTVGLLIPMNKWLSGKLMESQKAVLGATTSRVNLINESLSSVFAIKAGGIEDFALNKLETKRMQEVRRQRRVVFWQALMALCNEWANALVATLTFTAYYFSGGEMKAEVLIPTLGILNVIKFPITTLPTILSWFNKAKVSIARIETALNAETRDSRFQSSKLSKGTLRVDNVSFSYKPFPTTEDRVKQRAKAVLENVFFSLDSGDTALVMGSLGSGKTSLLLALLGELNVDGGLVDWNGSISYSSQQVWIREGTLRDNILMGRKYNAGRFHQVLQACALEEDIARLPQGEKTAVGDRGSSLSGGQRARVALARSCYQEADIYLIDDVLTSLDPSTRETVVEKCLNGLLGKKTLVLASSIALPKLKHNKTFLVEDRRLSLCASIPTRFKSHAEVESNSESAAKETEVRQSRSAGDTRLKVSPKGESLLDQIDRPFARRAYFRTFGPTLLVVGACSLSAQALLTLGDAWLGYWTANPTSAPAPIFLIVYMCLVGCAASFISARTLMFYKGCYAAATKIHIGVLRKLLSAPVAFLSNRKSGWFTNVLSRDQDVVDQAVPESMDQLVGSILRVSGVLVFNSILNPLFAIAVPPVLFVFMRVTRHYLAVSAKVRKLENNSRGFTTALNKEAYEGAVTLRALGVADNLMSEFCLLQDDVSRANNTTNGLSRWVGFRLEIVANTLVIVSCVMMVVLKGAIYPSYAGVAIISMLAVSKSVLMVCRRIGMFEVQFMSVEQLTGLMKLVPTEEDESAQLVCTTESSEQVPMKEKQSMAPSLRFEDFSASYDSQFVVTGISAEIPGGTSLGIIGRSGCGKTTLLNSILRLGEETPLEIANIKRGTIFIDEKPHTLLSRKFLRHELAVYIPQNSIIYEGSLKENVCLDCVDGKSDEQVIEILRRVFLDRKLEEIGLHGIVETGGKNLSLGERQLLCFARALARESSRLLLLDECTANLDEETEEKICRLLSTEFSNHTIIVVAHRPATIQNCDNLMVLDVSETEEIGSKIGRIVDFGPNNDKRLSGLFESDLLVEEKSI